MAHISDQDHQISDRGLRMWKWLENINTARRLFLVMTFANALQWYINILLKQHATIFVLHENVVQKYTNMGVCIMKSYLLMKIAGDDYPLQGKLNGTSAWGEWRLKTVLLPRCICQVFRHKLWHIHKGHFSDEVALHCICKHEHKGFDVSSIDGSSLHQENFLIRSNTANV